MKRPPARLAATPGMGFDSTPLAHGFSLIELMVVVAIIAILAAIAYPAYTSHIVRTHRVAGEACLSEYSNFMERFYTTNLAYDKDAAGTAVALPLLDCKQQTTNWYDYSLVASQLTASTYTLQAVPKGAQLTRDIACGTLTMDQKGTRTISGTDSLDHCW